MRDHLSVLCVHGIAHGDADPSLVPDWTKAITDALTRANPGLTVDLEFLRYDDFFEHAPLNPATYAAAVTSLLASGVIHTIGDLFPIGRGLFDLPDQIRWTAGMIAQWAVEGELRADLRRHLLETLAAKPYDLICAHSLGALICYDTFSRNPDAIQEKAFLICGSPIGNPFVRDVFAGRIEPLAARIWYNLYNPRDHVFTTSIRLTAPNFSELRADFDKPNDIFNHDPIWYFDHENAKPAWQDLSGALSARVVARDLRTAGARAPRAGRRPLLARPERRALLVGINAYPDPANRLEGCVNDVFLMSSVLQECGFRPEDIRIVLDDRATTAGILDRFHWLLDGVRAGDERILFYSGHGAQIPAYGAREEVDHLDECLVPVDFDWSAAHAITDKQFVEFYSQLPYDSRFIAVFDCCHSGGMTRDGGLKPRGISPPDDIRHRAMRWNLQLQMWEARELPSLEGSKRAPAYVGRHEASFRFGRGMALRRLPRRQYLRERKALGHRGPYLPTILEACAEEQLSYEYRDGATSYGAFTYSLAKVLRQSRGAGRNPTFQTLVKLTAGRLRALRYDQTPCLVGPTAVVEGPVPWVRPRRGGRGAKRARAGGRASGARRRARRKR